MVVLPQTHHGDPYVHARLLHGSAGQPVFLPGILIMTDTPPEKNEQDQVKTQTTGDRIAVVGRSFFFNENPRVKLRSAARGRTRGPNIRITSAS